ncbi:AT-hook motif nuclear-localized protein [Quillaja saponaria]|uniref:AT-hook motif nuclear-localized protein n=1 Tax=Quillaja saponaria TaxID=32244 RepID=A0AAD7PMX1_QUISA|nr:AT-hook motif nuclear-localized protein [Quillaja saponaria]
MTIKSHYHCYSPLLSKIPTMAERGRTVNLSHISDDESSDHSPHNMPTLSVSTGGCGGGGVGTSSSISKHKKSTPPPPPGYYLLSPNPSGQTHEPQNIITPTSMEVSKKPRGRPPGSKNKPKPPIVITKDSDSAMKPVILEISAGSDVVETLIHFARKRRVGISILSGSGSVSNVTLRPTISHAPTLSLNGPFSLLSLSGTYITETVSSKASCCSSFGICLAGTQGQIFGGIIGGRVTAASLVVVVVATFMNPTFHRLPSENEEGEEEAKPCIGGGNETTGAMSVYNVNVASPTPTPLNCQVPPDSMPWGSDPTSRSQY